MLNYNVKDKLTKTSTGKTFVRIQEQYYGHNCQFKRSTISIPYDLDFKFRKLASQKYKFEKG